MADPARAARGVCKPRRPQASPLFRLVSDHLHRLHRLQTVYDDRFAREYGPWRPVVGQVADKFLACGVLEHGFARIRCDACTHEYLLAFSCKCRCFCPSCPAHAVGALDPVARHDAARAGAAPARAASYRAGDAFGMPSIRHDKRQYNECGCLSAMRPLRLTTQVTKSTADTQSGMVMYSHHCCAPTVGRLPAKHVFKNRSAFYHAVCAAAAALQSRCDGASNNEMSRQS